MIEKINTLTYKEYKLYSRLNPNYHADLEKNKQRNLTSFAYFFYNKFISDYGHLSFIYSRQSQYDFKSLNV